MRAVLARIFRFCTGGSVRFTRPTLDRYISMIFVKGLVTYLRLIDSHYAVG